MSLDENGDGVLTWEEFYKGIKASVPEMSKPTLMQVFRHIDEDMNGVISWGEWKKRLDKTAAQHGYFGNVNELIEATCREDLIMLKEGQPLQIGRNGWHWAKILKVDGNRKKPYLIEFEENSEGYTKNWMSLNVDNYFWRIKGEIGKFQLPKEDQWVYHRKKNQKPRPRHQIERIIRQSLPRYDQWKLDYLMDAGWTEKKASAALVKGGRSLVTSVQILVKEQREERKKRKEVANYIELLRGVDLLQSLNDDELLLLANAAEKHEYHNRDLIIREGDEGDSMYICLEGNCVATKVLPGEKSRKPTIVRTYSPGNYFGELSLIRKGRPRGANIVSVAYCACISISRDIFSEVVGSIRRHQIIKRQDQMYKKTERIIHEIEAPISDRASTAALSRRSSRRSNYSDEESQDEQGEIS